MLSSVRRSIRIALVVIAVTYLRFQLAHRTEDTRWWRLKHSRDSRAPVPAQLGVSASRPITVPRVPRLFTATAGCDALWSPLGAPPKR